MHTKFSQFRAVSPEREKRLIGLDKQRRADLVEEAENTGGKMESKSAASQMEGETAKLSKKVLEMKVGWGEWINSFFRGKAALDKKMQRTIMDAAENHITAETDLAIGKIMGFFNRGKRKLYLATRERIANQIRSDLLTHLEKRQQQSKEKFGRYSGLANMLRTGTDPLRLTTDAQRKKITGSLQRLKSTFESEEKRLAKGAGSAPAEWESARETEQALKQQLLAFDVVDPVQLDDLLQRNTRGDKTLDTLVEQAQSLKADPEMKRFMLRALTELRTGYARFYRLSTSLNRDGNVGSVKDRLAFIQNDASVLGRKLKVSIASGTPMDTTVMYRGSGYALLRSNTDKDQYLVLDTQTGELTYRDSSRNFHDYPLTESAFSLAS